MERKREAYGSSKSRIGLGGSTTTGTKRLKKQEILLFVQQALGCNIELPRPVIYPGLACIGRQKDQENDANQSRHEGDTPVEACHSLTVPRYVEKPTPDRCGNTRSVWSSPVQSSRSDKLSTTVYQ